VNAREGIRRFSAVAFFAVIFATNIGAQGAPQKPSGDSPLPRPQSTAEATAPEWSEIVARTRPAVVVIETDEALASGFVVKPDGIIVTNYHVVANAKAMAVKFPSGEVYRNVYLLSSDPVDDLAFLKIEAVDLPTITLGNSNNVRLGDEVLLVGAPQGLEQTVSNGLISGIRLDDGVRVLQTSAAASPGSSGGPLLDRGGEAIGVMSFKLVNGENLNFTIPINYVRGKLGNLTLSNPEAFAPLKAQTERHRGVWVAGHGSAAFEEIYMDILDILGGSGVQIANNGAQRFTNTDTSGYMPLSALIEMLPKTGANSLLYITVEPGMTSLAATVHFQCFDATGRVLWDEKANDVLVNGGNTLFHPTGWKKKLRPHIGKPGLLPRQTQEEGSQEPKK
jgi:S1-C subfamily serine protease